MANGRMWVAPEAETDPRAVAMQGQGLHLPLDALLRRYLPPVSSSACSDCAEDDPMPAEILIAAAVGHEQQAWLKVFRV